MSGKPDEFLRMGYSSSTVPGGFTPYSKSKKSAKPASHEFDANGNIIDFSESFSRSSDADLLQEDDPHGTYYSIQELQDKSIPNLDSNHLEQYLRAQDFKQAMGMSKSEFEHLPKWKQTKAKKDAKLF
mmetsp:Transcript_16924/g.36920  ORF Transcript_16924/g.36920 Transcript_16924/m.36920 type:complete len:128 (-) Transcript_16924:144-527(-)|eukprot:CAMPEP_0168741332 /NCGR_PEP_ID=MMETSP0724-20121128/12456_1 /TAXON_ID=265536 /ORGANISM="Amphiprora sp., Strain CCMP467" /LENGTH=127 /DNA_ID=CAMNT_0008788827 /DNA_START=168 /DNA_END=551 /DNA_ORIENTATION=-